MNKCTSYDPSFSAVAHPQARKHTHTHKHTHTYIQYIYAHTDACTKTHTQAFMALEYLRYHSPHPNTNILVESLRA